MEYSQMEILMLDLQLQLYPIYTLSNGCSDTILVNVDGINVRDDTICQNSGIYTLNFSPLNGVWSVPPVNPLINSNCITSINNFPYQIDGRVVLIIGQMIQVMILIGL